MHHFFTFHSRLKARLCHKCFPPQSPTPTTEDCLHGPKTRTGSFVLVFFGFNFNIIFIRLWCRRPSAGCTSAYQRLLNVSCLNRIRIVYIVMIGRLLRFGFRPAGPHLISAHRCVRIWCSVLQLLCRYMLNSPQRGTTRSDMMTRSRTNH